MKHLFLIISLLLLTACGGGGGGGGGGGQSASIAPEDACSTPWECDMVDRLLASNEVDALTPGYKVRVRWEWTVPVQQRFDLALIDDAIDELNLCLPEPLDTSMIYIVLGAPEFIVNAWGQPSGLNILNTYSTIIDAPNWDPNILPREEYRYDRYGNEVDGIYHTIETIKHELTHIYLFQVGTPNIISVSHQSNLFPECSDLPWRTGDGIPLLGND